jgi:hypothetical protein
MAADVERENGQMASGAALEGWAVDHAEPARPFSPERTRRWPVVAAAALVVGASAALWVLIISAVAAVL